MDDGLVNILRNFKHPEYSLVYKNDNTQEYCFEVPARGSYINIVHSYVRVKDYSNFSEFVLLGEGSVGTVFLGMAIESSKKNDSVMAKPQAIKFYTPSNAAVKRNRTLSNERTHKLFRSSKYILQREYYPEEHTENSNHPEFLVMDVCQTIPDFLGRRIVKSKFSSGYSLEDILHVCLGISKGLFELEFSGRAYADVKMGNFGIILDRTDGDWRPVIIDVGSAGDVDTTETPVANFSDVAYIPPENRSITGDEQVAKAHNPKSTIWKFGVFMYELMSGEKGFYETEDKKIYEGKKSKLESIITDPVKYEAIRQQLKVEQLSSRGNLNSEYSHIKKKISSLSCDKNLKKILLNCLQPNVDDRYQSMSDVVLAIEDYQRSKKRNSLLSRLGLGLGLAGAIFGGVLTYLSSSHDSQLENQKKEYVGQLKEKTNVLTEIYNQASIIKLISESDKMLLEINSMLKKKDESYTQPAMSDLSENLMYSEIKNFMFLVNSKHLVDGDIYYLGDSRRNLEYDYNGQVIHCISNSLESMLNLIILRANYEYSLLKNKELLNKNNVALALSGISNNTYYGEYDKKRLNAYDSLFKKKPEFRISESELQSKLVETLFGKDLDSIEKNLNSHKEIYQKYLANSPVDELDKLLHPRDRIELDIEKLEDEFLLLRLKESKFKKNLLISEELRRLLEHKRLDLRVDSLITEVKK
jgi:serine/threonine protein kinase